MNQGCSSSDGWREPWGLDLTRSPVQVLYSAMAHSQRISNLNNLEMQKSLLRRRLTLAEKRRQTKTPKWLRMPMTVIRRRKTMSARSRTLRNDWRKYLFNQQSLAMMPMGPFRKLVARWKERGKGWRNKIQQQRSPRVSNWRLAKRLLVDHQ